MRLWKGRVLMRGEAGFIMKHSSGRRITYKQVGDGSGRPVVYFHGWGSAASSVLWDEEFLEQHRSFILLVNRPGYGGSDLVKDYSMVDYADDVKEVLDHLQIQKADIIGWSNGGLFCQVFAYRHPQYISSLSLAASAIPLHLKESRKVLPIRWKLLQKLNKIAPILNRKFAKRINKNWTGKIGRKILKYHNKYRNAPGPSGMKEQLKKQTAEGIWDAYRTKGWAEYLELNAMMKPFRLKEWNTPFPVYIWSGEEDALWPVKTAVFLHEKFRGSKMQIVKGKGHFFFLVCWEEILRKAMEKE
jgi:pimeloyl-ACP methyl ester carboxylesterase